MDLLVIFLQNIDELNVCNGECYFLFQWLEDIYNKIVFPIVTNIFWCTQQVKSTQTK